MRTCPPGPGGGVVGDGVTVAQVHAVLLAHYPTRRYPPDHLARAGWPEALARAQSQPDGSVVVCACGWRDGRLNASIQAPTVWADHIAAQLTSGEGAAKRSGG